MQNRIIAEAEYLPEDILLGYSRICCALSQVCGALSFMGSKKVMGVSYTMAFFIFQKYIIGGKMLCMQLFGLWYRHW